MQHQIRHANLTWFNKFVNDFDFVEKIFIVALIFESLHAHIHHDMVRWYIPPFTKQGFKGVFAYLDPARSKSLNFSKTVSLVKHAIWWRLLTWKVTTLQPHLKALVEITQFGNPMNIVALLYPYQTGALYSQPLPAFQIARIPIFSLPKKPSFAERKSLIPVNCSSTFLPLRFMFLNEKKRNMAVAFFSFSLQDEYD